MQPNRNVPICQIYPLLFRSHNDKTENSDHIIQVLFSAHSAEAAVYVLVSIVNIFVVHTLGDFLIEILVLTQADRMGEP